jgi:hypothetical protein
MTIAMLACRPPYALVAADRLYRGMIFEQGRDPVPLSGFHTKVWIHPSLPIAVATAGIAVLGAEPTAAVIERVLSEPITGSPSKVIGYRLRDVLQPLVIQELDMGGYADMPPEHAVVAVYIAVSEGGKAGGAILKVGRTSTMQGALNAVGPPKSAEAAYASRSESSLFAYHLSDPKQLADHMRRVIREGIAESERVLGSEAEAGGEVDVALVDPNGARFLAAASQPAGRKKNRQAQKRRRWK